MTGKHFLLLCAIFFYNIQLNKPLKYTKHRMEKRIIHMIRDDIRPAHNSYLSPSPL